MKIHTLNQACLIDDLVIEWKKLLKNSYLDKGVKSLDATEDMVYLALRAKPYEKFEDRFNLEKITKER